VPPRVDVETVESVQEQLRRNKELSGRNNKHSRYQLLRCGRVKCGYCNKNMIVTYTKGRHSEIRIDYRCATHGQVGGNRCQGAIISAPNLDAVVWQDVVKMIQNPGVVEQALKAEKKEDPNGQDLKIVEKNIADLDRKRKRNIAALEDDIDEETYKDIKARLKTLAEEKQAWERQRTVLLEQKVSLEEEQRAWENFRKWCEDIREKLDDPTHEVTYEEKRRACERLGIKVLVWRVEQKPRYQITARPSDFVSTCISATCHSRRLKSKRGGGMETINT